MTMKNAVFWDVERVDIVWTDVSEEPNVLPKRRSTHGATSQKMTFLIIYYVVQIVLSLNISDLGH
jgi:hypothetical protein